MKKLLASVVALAMTAGLALSMTACGFTGGGGIKGEELPSGNFEEAWAVAFDEANFENFKLTGKGTTKFSVNGMQGSETMTFTSVRANGLEHGTASLRRSAMGQSYTGKAEITITVKSIM